MGSAIAFLFIGCIAGFAACHLFYKDGRRFIEGQEAKITAQIELIKDIDVARYARLKNEWHDLLSNTKAKISLTTDDLKKIILYHGRK